MAFKLLVKLNLVQMRKFVETSQPLTKEDIASLKQVVGKPFPEELEKFYLENNGGIPAGEAIFYVDEDNDVDVSVKTFLPIKHKRYERDTLLEKVYRTFVVDKKLVSAEFIPFAIDEGAFPYCYKIADGSIHLFCMDDLESKDGPMRFVASSLKVFVEGLADESEAYG